MVPIYSRLYVIQWIQHVKLVMIEKFALLDGLRLLKTRANMKTHKSHEIIFGRRYSGKTVVVYVCLAVLAGILFGSSPLVIGLISGLRDQGGDTKNHGRHSIYNNHHQHHSLRVAPSVLSASSSILSSSQLGNASGRARPRLLFQTASYTMDQFHGLQKAMDCMRDICNAGWDVTVVMQTASGFDEKHERYEELRERMYCIDKNAYIPLHIQKFKKIGFGLNSRHRLYLQEHLQEHDYFSFAEEDMLLTLSHLKAVVEFENTLKRALPKTWLRYTPGFIRYEDSKKDTERVSWEYFPDKTYVVDMSLQSPLLGQYLFTLNMNQAIYVISRAQLVDMEQRCGFLSDIGQNSFYRQLRKAMDAKWNYISVGVSEWSSSFQQILQCGLRRITPIGSPVAAIGGREGEGKQLLPENNNKWSNFVIHHSVNKAQTRRLRKELLNQRDWARVVQQKSTTPISIEEAASLVWDQYNLGGIDKTKFDTGDRVSRWDWELPPEE